MYWGRHYCMFFREKLGFWRCYTKGVVSQPLCLSCLLFFPCFLSDWLWCVVSKQKGCRTEGFRTLCATGQPTCWAMQPNTVKVCGKSDWPVIFYSLTTDLFDFSLILLCLSGKKYLFLNVLGHLGRIYFVQWNPHRYILYVVCWYRRQMESFIYKLCSQSILHLCTRHLYLIWFCIMMFLEYMETTGLFLKMYCGPVLRGEDDQSLCHVLLQQSVKAPPLHQIALTF